MMPPFGKLSVTLSPTIQRFFLPRAVPAVFVATASTIGFSPAVLALYSEATDGRGRAGAETGNHRQAASGSVAGLVALLHRVSSALFWGTRRTDGAGESLGHRAAIIGRRAERIHNHDPKGVAAYVGKHLILARGRHA